MPWELIYTSAPRGLIPGQSGFCTVARSSDIREGLAQRLEQISYYEHSRAVAASGPPVVSVFRIIDVRGTPYYVLSKIRDAGLDFTNRTNHLAHHLAFDESELASLPDPASLLAYWTGWRTSWSGDPRMLPPVRIVDLASEGRVAGQAKTWEAVTGDAGRAAALVETAYSRGVFLMVDQTDEATVLALFSESLRLLDPDGKAPASSWQYPFTSTFQGRDATSDFAWRCCRTGTEGMEVALRSGQRPLALSDLVVPPGAKAELARTGPVLRTKVHRVNATPQVPRSNQRVIQKAEESNEPEESHSKDLTIFATAALLIAATVISLFVWPGFFRAKSKVAPTQAKATANVTSNSPPPEAKRFEIEAPQAASSPALTLVKEDLQQLVSTPIYFATRDGLFAPTPKLIMLLETNGVDWRVDRVLDSNSWKRLRSAKIESGDRKLKVIDASQTLVLERQVGKDSVRLTWTGRTGGCTHFWFRSPSDEFRVIILDKDEPFYVTDKLFPAELEQARIQIGDGLNQLFTELLTSKVVVGWSVRGALPQFPPKLDVASERSSAEAETAVFGKKNDLLSSARTNILSTNAVFSTFDRFLTLSKKEPGLPTFLEYLGYLAADASNSRVFDQKLKGYYSLSGYAKKQLLREVYSNIVQKFPTNSAPLMAEDLIEICHGLDGLLVSQQNGPVKKAVIEKILSDRRVLLTGLIDGKQYALVELVDAKATP